MRLAIDRSRAFFSVVAPILNQPRLLIVAVTGALILAACTEAKVPTTYVFPGAASAFASADSGPNSAGADTLMHLYVGSTWSYSVSDSVVGPEKLGSSLVRTFTFRVSRDTVVEGEHWAEVDSLDQLENDAPPEVITYLTNRAHGIYRRGSRLVTFSLPPLLPPQAFASLFLEYPASPGDQPLPLPNRNPPYALWTVVDTGVVVSTPAGVFRCVQIERAGENATFWSARGVGVVKVVKLVESGGVLSGPVTYLYRVAQLTSYSPGPH